MNRYQSLCALAFARKFCSRNNGTVFNDFGIELLPKAWSDVLFSYVGSSRMNPKKREAALRHLSLFNINALSKVSSSKAPNLKMPPLYGNIETHFLKISKDQAKPYFEVLESFLRAISNGSLPKRPVDWNFRTGWTRYDKAGFYEGTVAAPLEDCFSLDVEVCVSEGNHPVLATAVSNEAWYSWCSPHLVDKTKPSLPLNKSDLIPVEMSAHNYRLIIGHNVGYDRARCAEVYSLGESKTRFLDTMSLHISISGMTSGQRAMKIKSKSEVSDINLKWMSSTSLNNLKDVHSLYCPNSLLKLDKEQRGVFLTRDGDEIRKCFQELMHYCANDTMATAEIMAKLFPLFRQQCPHPVSFVGLLDLGATFLPTDYKNWQLFIHRAQESAKELEAEVLHILEIQAKEALQLAADDAFRQDLWMWDKDWTPKHLRMKKKSTSLTATIAACKRNRNESEFEYLERKFRPLMKNHVNMYKNQPKLPGYPNWYQELCSKPGPNWNNRLVELTPSKSIAPSLMRLTYRGFPLYRHPVEKWGYIVPSGMNIDDVVIDDFQSTEFPSSSLHKFVSKYTVDSSRSSYKTETSKCDFFVQDPPDLWPIGKRMFQKVVSYEPINLNGDCLFYRMPHKNGNDCHVGNPLAKDFLEQINDGILSTDDNNNRFIVDTVLRAGKMLAYWHSNQDRIRNQLVVQCTPDLSVILPQVVAAGTLTRRAVERTWLTASNAREDRIGSELKAMIQAPPGYHIVGADVDSQELWIAALLGDAAFTGEHGSTALGWMTLQGKKVEATDLHSVTAATVGGISRDQAKVLNYGRIYGAGMPFAKRLLRQFNAKLSEEDATEIASRMYSATKGERNFVLSALGAEYLNLAQPGNKYVCGDNVPRSLMYLAARAKQTIDMLFTKNHENQFIPNDLGLQILDDVHDKVFSLDEIHDLLKSIGNLSNANDRSHLSLRKSFDVLSLGTVWSGGSESYTFNELERIAMNTSTSTPILKCQITRALDSRSVGSDYLPSRVNWVVQSSAVDYLHLLLVAMQWLSRIYGVHGARLLLSVHDEVRFLVPSSQRYQAALALHMSNLMVRAMFASRLGMNSLPLSVAFFSLVDIDTVFRKESHMECVTPSNPAGLSLGYGILPGESLSIDEVLKKLGH